jgi:predicted MFS family arabinose efflux permease
VRRFDAAIMAVITAVLIAGLAAISWETVRAARGLLLPALDQKADTVARSVASLVDEAATVGIPLDRLVRAEEVLEEALTENPEFAFLAIRDGSGRIVASAREADVPEAALTEVTPEIQLTEAPVRAGAPEYGAVVVGTPVAVARTVLRDLGLDVAVLLVVAVLVALELIAFAFSLSSTALVRGLAGRLDSLRREDFRLHPPVPGTGPLAEELSAVDAEVARVRSDHLRLREAAAAAGDAGAVAALDSLAARTGLSAVRHTPSVSLVAVRAPVFLFFFAEELTRPFLPSFIKSLAQPVAGLSTEMVIAIPIILFMLIVALGQPILNTWTERFGRARSLRAGALIAIVGYLGTSQATDIVELIGFRTITAIGFGTVFVAAQGYIVDRTGAANRARGIGLFVSAIMAAMLCGPPIGGIVADRLGVNAAFVMSAAMALVAYICAYVALPKDPAARSGTARGVRLRDVGVVLAQPVLFLLIVGCAVPAKMMLIGLVMYYLPLDLAAAFEPAVIGRVLMLYGLAMLVIVPLVSRLSDEGSRRVPYVVLGGILGGTSVVHLFLWPEPWGAALMVLQIGIAQGISTTPQSALVGELGKRILPDLSEGGLYGVFRLVERLGTAAGPAFVGWIWGVWGGETAVIVTAGVAIAGALLFGLAAALAGRRPIMAAEAS